MWLGERKRQKLNISLSSSKRDTFFIERHVVAGQDKMVKKWLAAMKSEKGNMRKV